MIIHLLHKNTNLVIAGSVNLVAIVCLVCGVIQLDIWRYSPMRDPGEEKKMKV